MTSEEKKQAFKFLNEIQAKRDALKTAQEKIMELLNSNDGFTNPNIDFEIAIDIYKWMNAENQSHKEFIEAKSDYMKFMKNTNQK